MFVNVSYDVEFDAKGMSGIRMTWEFDEMFSANITADYDKNRNEKFDPKEIPAIKKEAFSYVKEQGYFTHIEIEKKLFPIKYVKDFKPSIEKGVVVYRFFIPCHISAGKNDKKISIGVYDTTFFVDFNIKNEKSVKLNTGKHFLASKKLIDNTKKKIYYGQMSPKEIHLTFRKR